MVQKYQFFFVSPNEILSVKFFGLTLFDITDCVDAVDMFWSKQQIQEESNNGTKFVACTGLKLY